MVEFLLPDMSKGFTLLELIIVIGILAILGTVSVLVLNPAQLFAQARDTTRIQDLQTLNSALGLYVSSVSSPDLDGTTSMCSTLCYVGANLGLSAGCQGAGVTARHGTKTATYLAARTVNGTGWVPVAFSDISGGAPLATLPVDPTNDTTYFYSYVCDNAAKTYELNGNLESTRYTSGADDREGPDGGNNAAIYEIGTAPGLAL